MRFLLGFLVLGSLFAGPPNVPTSIDFDPAVCVFNSVNVTTGNYYEAHSDLVVTGPEPIVIHRSHISGDLEPHPGAWRFHNEEIRVYAYYRNRNPIGNFNFKQTIHLHEASGKVTEFDASCRCGYHYKDPSHWDAWPLVRADYCNTSGGTLSAKSHPINYHLMFDRHAFRFTLETGSGERREYKSLDTQYIYEGCYSPYEKTFVLVKVTRPNGNRLLYTYDAWHRVQQIEAFDSTETNLLAWARFSYASSNGNKVSKVETSDGQTLRYGYETERGVTVHPRRRPILKSVFVNEEAKASYRHDQHRITRREDACGGFLEIGYLNNSGKDLRRQYPSTFRVASQQAPVGPNGEAQLISQFRYGHRDVMEVATWAEAWDAQGNLRRYHFSLFGKPYLIESYEKQKGRDVATAFEGFWWERKRGTCFLAGHCRSTTSSGKAEYCRHLQYDDRGNVIRDSLIGNLTGRSPDNSWQVQLDQTHFRRQRENAGLKCWYSNKGCYSKSYTYSGNGFNNVLVDDDGRRKVVFTYLENTDLVSTKQTYAKDENENEVLCEEEAFEYDNNRCLAFHRHFDGFRTRVREIVACPTGPGYGLPQTIEEFALDNDQKILIKKEQFRYSQRNLVIEKEVYGQGTRH